MKTPDSLKSIAKSKSPKVGRSVEKARLSNVQAVPAKTGNIFVRDLNLKKLFVCWREDELTKFWPQLTWLLAAAVAYWLVASLGLLFVSMTDGIASIWPVSGLALAMIMLSPRRLRVKLFAVFFLTNALSNLTVGNSLIVSLGYALANTAETWLAFSTVAYFCKNKITFETQREIYALFAAAIFANGMTAILGATVSFLAFGALFVNAWLLWWTADGLGIILVTPLVVSLFVNTESVKMKSWRHLAGFAVPIAMMAFFILLIFTEAIFVEVTDIRNYYLFPLLIWLSYKFKTRGVSVILFCFSTVVIWSLIMGQGIFAFVDQTVTERLEAGQTFLFIFSFTGLLFCTGMQQSKKAEDDLRKSEARFRGYFNMPLYGIAITSPVKGWIEVNDRVCSMFGYNREELYRMTWSEMTYPDDLEADVRQFDKLLAGKIEQYNLDKRFIKKDGSIIWTHLSVGCVRKPDGRVDFVIAFLEDVTEREQGRQYLVKITADLKEAEEIAGLGRYKIDMAKGKWTSSRKLDVIFGIDWDYNRNLESWVKLIHPDYRKTMNDYLTSEAISQKKLFDREYKIINQSNGQERWVHDIGKVELDDSGKPIGIVGVIMDITDRKMSEDAKTDFVLLASHQLRTPLSSIKWVLDVFNQDKDLSPKQKERIRDLYISNERLIELVNSLLKLSRMETSQITVSKEKVGLGKLIESLLKALKPDASKKLQQLKFIKPASQLPASIDIIRFEEAFNNLLNNAIIYSPKGQVITVTVGIQDKEYLIAVHNDEPVISRQDQQKLFTRFSRGEKSQQVDTSGSGLGLYIAKKAVELNGGKIWLESKIGSGTTFYFTVPR